MKNLDFLRKLAREGKLAIVEPSDDIKDSYLAKADNCLKSAKILLQSGLYENSVGEAYYGMYNCLSALLYKAGVKCENHSASIILLWMLFKANGLAKTISLAKRERIDKQYSLICLKRLIKGLFLLLIVQKHIGFYGFCQDNIFVFFSTPRTDSRRRHNRCFINLYGEKSGNIM